MLAPSGPTGHHPTAVELTSPSYARATGTASFTLTPDRGERKADALWLSKLSAPTAAHNGRVVLFIDNASAVTVTPAERCILGPGGANSCLPGPTVSSTEMPMWMCNSDPHNPVWLCDANLDGPDLIDANLTNANLTNADLSNAYMYNANLTNANLTNADLSNAYLFNANLTNANLSGTYFCGTTMPGGRVNNSSC